MIGGGEGFLLQPAESIFISTSSAIWRRRRLTRVLHALYKAICPLYVCVRLLLSFLHNHLQFRL